MRLFIRDGIIYHTEFLSSNVYENPQKLYLDMKQNQDRWASRKNNFVILQNLRWLLVVLCQLEQEHLFPTYNRKLLISGVEYFHNKPITLPRLDL